MSMNNFTFEETKIKGLVIVTPKVFGDHRGYFMESYSKRHFAEGGIDIDFVQGNQSKSVQGTLRGLHYQTKHSQGKLVSVIKGEVFDVCASSIS